MLDTKIAEKWPLTVSVVPRTTVKGHFASVGTDSQFARRNGESLGIMIVPGNAPAKETLGRIDLWMDSQFALKYCESLYIKIVPGNAPAENKRTGFPSVPQGAFFIFPRFRNSTARRPESKRRRKAAA